MGLEPISPTGEVGVFTSGRPREKRDLRTRCHGTPPTNGITRSRRRRSFASLFALLEKKRRRESNPRTSCFAGSRLTVSDDVKQKKQRLAQESNLAYDHRKVACESSTLASRKKQVADAGVEPAGTKLMRLRQAPARPQRLEKGREGKCAGTELNRHSSETSGLQPLGLANAQPTRIKQVARVRVELTKSRSSELRRFAKVCVPCLKKEAETTAICYRFFQRP